MAKSNKKPSPSAGITHLVEPTRRSMLDHLKENLKYGGSKTYILRAIIIGDHEIGASSEWGIGEVFHTLVQEINEGYCDEKLSGFVLSYPQYFCTVLEGSEDTVKKFTQLLLEKYGSEIGNLRYLAQFHHCFKRLCEDWYTTTGKPSRLMIKIDPECNLTQTYEQVKICVRKIFDLGQYLNTNKGEEKGSDLGIVKSRTFSMATVENSMVSTYSVFQPDVGTNSVVPNDLPARTTSIKPSAEKSKLKRNLPEYGLLSFLLNSPYLHDVRLRLHISSNITCLDIVEEMTWPPAKPLCPTWELFLKAKDPVEDLPATYFGPVNKEEKFFYI